MRFARILALLLATTPACVLGGSQVYQQDAQGGVLILEGNETDAMKDANARMTAHCGGPQRFAIVKRETVVVGNEQYTNAQSGFQENADRQTAGVAASQTQTDHEAQYAAHSQEREGWNGSEQATQVASHSQTTTQSASAVATDEREQRSGQAASSTVSGVREVREQRLHYVCR